jgi:hypothetical protein
MTPPPRGGDFSIAVLVATIAVPTKRQQVARYNFANGAVSHDEAAIGGLANAPR